MNEFGTQQLNPERGLTPYTAELYNPSTVPWAEIEEQVKAVLQSALPQIDKHYLEGLEENFTDPENIVVLARTSNNNLIGLTICSPTSKDSKVANTDFTAVIPEEQGKHLVAKLMEVAEAELKRRGYLFMTTQARIQNGYANKVRKHYNERIVSESKMSGSAYGPRINFKIKLQELNAKPIRKPK